MNVTAQTSGRRSNIELLRIIAILMIVAHHFALFSDLTYPAGTLSVSRFWVDLLLVGGKTGACIYVLITGYFLVDSRSFKPSRIVKLWLQIFFYSVAIYLILAGTGMIKFSFNDLLHSIFPISFDQYWFATTYFLLYLFYPFINVLINNLSKKQHLTLLLLFFVLLSVIPSLLDVSYILSYFVNFVFFYCIGGFIKRHVDMDKTPTGQCFAVAAILIVLTAATPSIFSLAGTMNESIESYAYHFFGNTSLTVILIAVFLFTGTVNTKIGDSRIINIIAKSCFGIYLIHENPNLRSGLWLVLFKGAQYKNSLIIIPYSLLATIIIFVSAALIELLRIYLIENRYSNLLTKMDQPLKRKWDSIMDKLAGKS